MEATHATVCLSCLKWRRPLVSPPDAQILRQLKTVMRSCDVKWERGQVNHRVKEIKDDGRTAVWKRWVVVRGRLDPTATFLFLADKGVLICALIFPPSLFCALYLFLYSVFHLFLLVFACAMQQWGECGLLSLPEVPCKSVRFILYIYANVFVCVAFAPVAHLSHFWRNMVAVRSMASWSKMCLHVVLRIHSRDVRAEASGRVCSPRAR